MSNREHLIQILTATEELKRRKRDAPLQFVNLHKKQQDFFQLLKDAVRCVLFSGGNRSGKTVAHAICAICYAYGYWIFDAFADGAITLTEDGDYPPREAVPPKYWIRRADGVPLRGERRIVCITGLSLLKGIGNILWPEFENWLPFAMRSKLKIQRGAYGVPLKVSHPLGYWTIDFGSVEQGSMQFEGAKYDFAAFDEPPHRTVFTSVWRGLIDYFGSFIMTFTPLGNHAPWLYEEFYAGERDDVGIVEVTQSDNPYLTTEALSAFEKGVQFTEEELLARKTGKFGFLTHRAFQSYDDEVHLIEPFEIPKSWPRMCVCDPASRRPFYFLWLAFDQQRKVWIAYREFPFDKLHHQYRTSDWTIQDYATIIRNLEGEERVDVRVIDPRFGPAEYTIKGQKMTSVCEDFARYGLFFDPRVPDTGREETGIERLRQVMWYDPRLPIDRLNNYPHFVIFNTLKSLPHALLNYSFVPPNLKDDRVLADKTAEAFKDPIDAARYGILYGPPMRSDQTLNSYIPDQDWETENEIDDSWI